LGDVVVPEGKPFGILTKSGRESVFTDTQPWEYLIVLTIYLFWLISELSHCPTVLSQVFGRCRRPREKTYLICKPVQVMYQDSAHSPQLYRGIQAMSSRRKTFLIL